MKSKNSGIGIGLVLGVAFGAAMDNIGIGIALGIAFAIAFGGFSKDEKSTRDEQNKDQEQ